MVFGLPLDQLIGIVVALAAAGAACGIVAGLFGIGGGAITVPVLYELFRWMGVDEAFRMHLSVGTSLAVIVPTAYRSYRAHRARGTVDMAVLRIWAVPVVLGVVVGSLAAGYLSSDFLKGVFALLTFLIAAKMLSGNARWRLADDLPGKPLLRVLGAGIGMLAVWIGVGGGALVNMLFAFCNRPVHQGVATGAGVGVLVSIPGTIGFMLAGLPHMSELAPLSLGFVSLIGTLLIAPTSVLTAPLGVRIAQAFSRRQLETALGLYFVVVGARFALDLAGIVP